MDSHGHDMNSFTPSRHFDRRRLSRSSRALRAAAAAIASLACIAPAGAAYVLAPQYAGTFADGSGADAAFHRIDNAWAGSAVLWNEDAGTFGSGVPVSTFRWGTGLWGQVDWLAVQQAAAGQSSAASGAIVESFTDVLPGVSHANSRYNECHGGTVPLLPFFSPAPDLGDCGNAEAGALAQHNWTARYSGYIRITDPGEYNFGVLHDDGFFFRLIGAGGDELAIGRDYLNPPLRVGFAENLVLDAGLYGFELGAWNHLGAGVVDLRWASDCAVDCEWTSVPTTHLVSASEVPEPPAWALALIGLMALLALPGLPAARARLQRLRRLPGPSGPRTECTPARA